MKKLLLMALLLMSCAEEPPLKRNFWATMADGPCDQYKMWPYTYARPDGIDQKMYEKKAYAQADKEGCTVIAEMTETTRGLVYVCCPMKLAADGTPLP